MKEAPLFGRCPKIVSLTEIIHSSSSFSPARRERTVARTEFKIFMPCPARIFSPTPNPKKVPTSFFGIIGTWFVRFILLHPLIYKIY